MGILGAWRVGKRRTRADVYVRVMSLGDEEGMRMELRLQGIYAGTRW